MHRLRQDETWHFYEGNPLSVCILGAGGTCRVERMGRDADRGEHLQLVLRAREIFGASVARPGGYALLGCTVAPGFEFQDFELVSRERLIAAYPAHEDLILQYTRGTEETA